MKLRYYLRGLGIGIVVTALIFCITSGDRKEMTDDEIRARAMELGMVESSSRTLADIEKNMEESTEESVEESTEESVEESKEEIVEESKEEIVEETTEEIVEEITQEILSSEENGNDGPAEMINITVESGVGSYAVSKLLEDRMLVEDAGEFDEFLCDNGYSRSIRAGNYKIPVNATWDEMAKIICGKQ